MPKIAHVAIALAALAPPATATRFRDPPDHRIVTQHDGTRIELDSVLNRGSGKRLAAIGVVVPGGNVGYSFSLTRRYRRKDHRDGRVRYTARPDRKGRFSGPIPRITARFDGNTLTRLTWARADVTQSVAGVEIQ